MIQPRVIVIRVPSSHGGSTSPISPVCLDTTHIKRINQNANSGIIDHCNRHIVTHSQVKRASGSLRSRFAYLIVDGKAQFILAGQHCALTIHCVAKRLEQSKGVARWIGTVIHRHGKGHIGGVVAKVSFEPGAILNNIDRLTINTRHPAQTRDANKFELYARDIATTAISHLQRLSHRKRAASRHTHRLRQVCISARQTILINQTTAQSHREIVVSNGSGSGRTTYCQSQGFSLFYQLVIHCRH